VVPFKAMTLPLPMPDLDASEQEWIEYIKKLTVDELIELIDIYENLVEVCRKRKRELQSLGAA
jgi:hypothetical protein